MNALVFGGTSEGRRLAAALARSGAGVTLQVATEFGRGAASGLAGADIRAGRLDVQGMAELLSQGAYDCVIDATHPYAALATRNIRLACGAAGVRRIRLKRPPLGGGGAEYVPDAAAAAEIIEKGGGNALLAVGSKELARFTRVTGYAERLFVRILPMGESLQSAIALGFRGSNIICMQGPFDREMNAATLKMARAEYLVTKDSGGAGGFEAKLSAARGLGVRVIVIARPDEDEGFTYEEILESLGLEDEADGESARAGSNADSDTSSRPDGAAPSAAAFFPMFTDLRGKKALVIGGGRVAGRRAEVLAGFGAKVTVISPSVADGIERMASRGEAALLRRRYATGDIARLAPFLVIAATDDREANRAAMAEAGGLGIPVSVADRMGECSFFFPAIARGGGYVTGLVSETGDHAGVKRVAEQIRDLLGGC